MLKDINYIELCVSNIIQAAYFYRQAFGFSRSNAGSSSRDSQASSILLEHNDIQLLLRSSADPQSEIAKHVDKHGDGVSDIAFLVADVERAYALAMAGGATAVCAPTWTETPNGAICKAIINTFGDTLHTLTARSCKALAEPVRSESTGWPPRRPKFTRIDHIAICLNPGELGFWVDFYCAVFGFVVASKEYVDTGKSGMDSVVLVHYHSQVVLVFTEPLAGYQNSQTQEYLNLYKSAGVQHLAFATDNIRHAMRWLTAEGVEVLDTPEGYYDLRLEQLPTYGKLIHSLRSGNVFIDQNSDGVLLQAFTKPLQTRATFFVEIIERQGMQGFGSGNITALFKAMEQAQMRRGTL